MLFYNPYFLFRPNPQNFSVSNRDNCLEKNPSANFTVQSERFTAIHSEKSPPNLI